MADEHIAEKMSDAMREGSVAEFFEKNRHLLGYENATKALLTVVKELLDNSLDACNEAEILPEVKITIKQINEERFKVTVEDNGPGIKEEKVPYAFGKLLYGSKFYRMRQSRGIQGLGGHGAVLYSQLTTGKPTTIISSIGGKVARLEDRDGTRRKIHRGQAVNSRIYQTDSYGQSLYTYNFHKPQWENRLQKTGR